MNCGFHCWVDKEWPDTLKNALSKLWTMYNECHSSFIDERYQSSKMLKDLADEKEKMEKKHACIMEEACKLLDATVKKNQMHNLDMMNKEKLEDDQKDKLIADLKKDVAALMNAKEQLKNLVKTQAEVFKVKKDSLVAVKNGLLEEKNMWEAEKVGLLEENKMWEAARDGLLEEKKQWEAEKDALLEENKMWEAAKDALLEEKNMLVAQTVGMKEKKMWEAERDGLLAEKKMWEAEKKNLEHSIYDMLQVCDVHKQKLKKIRVMCDE